MGSVGWASESSVFPAAELLWYIDMCLDTDNATYVELIRSTGFLGALKRSNLPSVGHFGPGAPDRKKDFPDLFYLPSLAT